MARVATCPRCHTQMALPADLVAAAQLCCPLCDQQFKADPARLMQLPVAKPVMKEISEGTDSDLDPSPTDSTLVAPPTDSVAKEEPAKQVAETVHEPAQVQRDQSANGTVTGGGTITEEAISGSSPDSERIRQEIDRELPASSSSAKSVAANQPTRAPAPSPTPSQQSAPNETLDEWLHRTTQDSSWQANTAATPATADSNDHADDDRETLHEPPTFSPPEVAKQEPRQQPAPTQAQASAQSSPPSEKRSQPTSPQLQSLLEEFRGSDTPKGGDAQPETAPAEEQQSTPAGQTVEFAPGMLDQLRQRKQERAQAEAPPTQTPVERTERAPESKPETKPENKAAPRPEVESQSKEEPRPNAEPAESQASERVDEKPLARDFGFDFGKLPAVEPTVGAQADAMLAGQADSYEPELPKRQLAATTTAPDDVKEAVGVDVGDSCLAGEGSGPRRPLMRRTAGVVGGGLLGLAVGYVVLMGVGGDETDSPQAVSTSPGATEDGNSETFGASDSPSDSTTRPRTAPQAEILANFESPSEEPNPLPEEPNSLEETPAIDLQAPRSLATNTEPPNQLVPPTKPLPMTPASKSPVVGAPVYGVDRLTAAMRGAEEARIQIAENSLQDPQSRAVIGHAYAKLCELAQVITFLDSDESHPQMSLTRMEAQDVFRRLLVYQHARDDAHETAAHWLNWVDRPHGGIFFSALPTQATAAGEYYEYTMPLPDGKQVPALSATQIDVTRFVTSKEVGLVGCIIESPAERIEGYTGNAERVIWIGHTVPLGDAERE